MDKNGLVYVPDFCKLDDAKCPVHVALHGCAMGINSNYNQLDGRLYGDQFAIDTGYLQHAVREGVIVLMPQAQSGHLNENGCWDFRGFTDFYFDTNKGIQPSIINDMVTRIMSSSSTPLNDISSIDISCSTLGLTTIICIIVCLIKERKKNKSKTTL